MDISTSTKEEKKDTTFLLFELFDKNHLDLFAGKTRWQRLGEFLSFVRIFHGQSVQVSAAANLELCALFTFGDLDRFGVLSAGLLEEIADVCDLLWLREEKRRREEEKKRRRKRNKKNVRRMSLEKKNDNEMVLKLGTRVEGKQQQGMRALSFCKTRNQKRHGSSATGSGTPCSGALSSCSWCIVAGGSCLSRSNK